MSELLTADHSCTLHNKMFLKKLLKNSCFASLRFFWHLFRPNWSIIRDTESLWKMFENGKIVVFEGKCLTVTRMMYKFGRIRCQKKRKDVSYQLLEEFYKNISTVKNSFSTYVNIDSYFCECLYDYVTIYNCLEIEMIKGGTYQMISSRKENYLMHHLAECTYELWKFYILKLRYYLLIVINRALEKVAL